MAQSVSLEQIGARKRFGADLTLVRLFLRVHANMPTEVVETLVRLGTAPAAVQPLATWAIVGGTAG